MQIVTISFHLSDDTTINANTHYSFDILTLLSASVWRRKLAEKRHTIMERVSVYQFESLAFSPVYQKTIGFLKLLVISVDTTKCSATSFKAMVQ